MKFAVMGSPIAHSHSPTLHRAGFEYLGLDAEYLRIEKTELKEHDLEGFAGLSLTMPLKDDAFRLADSHDDESLATGVSNALLMGDDRVFGMNSDVYGIQISLEKLDFENVQIIGTGATAKSAAYAVRDKQVFFVGRNGEKVAAIESWASIHQIDIAHSDEVDLVIDTTPAESRLEYVKHEYLLDVAYNSERNARHPKLISGLEMLLNQAVVQNIAFASAHLDEKIDFVELTDAMREALVSRVGEWANA